MISCEFLLFPTQMTTLRCRVRAFDLAFDSRSNVDRVITASVAFSRYSRQRIANYSQDVDATAHPGKHCSSDYSRVYYNRSLCTVYLCYNSMKQATTGSGSAADPSFPDTAAANADLEARLTGGNTGGAGSAMPNEAQVCS